MDRRTFMKGTVMATAVTAVPLRFDVARASRRHVIYQTAYFDRITKLVPLYAERADCKLDAFDLRQAARTIIRSYPRPANAKETLVQRLDQVARLYATAFEAQPTPIVIAQTIHQWLSHYKAPVVSIVPVLGLQTAQAQFFGGTALGNGIAIGTPSSPAFAGTAAVTALAAGETFDIAATLGIDALGAALGQSAATGGISFAAQGFAAGVVGLAAGITLAAAIGLAVLSISIQGMTDSSGNATTSPPDCASCSAPSASACGPGDCGTGGDGTGNGDGSGAGGGDGGDGGD